MRVLLLGGDGQVGSELRTTLGAPGTLGTPAAMTVTTRASLDLGDLDALRSTIRAARPELVVCAAAWTDVDGAEADPDGAMRINRDAVAAIGEESRRGRFALLHFSTDFVFDGASSGRAYVEDDPPNPLSVYGRSKLGGERALLETDAPAIVLRTAWVWSLRRKSFVTSILRLARERTSLRVVDDQIGNPTWARDLAVASAAVVARACADAGGDVHAGFTAARGVYHAAGAGAVSRFDFARAILDADPGKAEHVVTELLPVSSAAFPLPARRPTHAPLDPTRLRERFAVSLPPWRDALERAFRAPDAPTPRFG
ncbi:MAG: dTDP-4-dehydrorhamnose reductase [Polyangiales bacterium]